MARRSTTRVWSFPARENLLPARFPKDRKAASTAVAHTPSGRECPSSDGTVAPRPTTRAAQPAASAPAP